MPKVTITVASLAAVSDGFHTMAELYEHRCLLFILLALSNREKASWRPDFEGWFALYLELPKGQISYHIPVKYLPLITGKIAQVLTNPWDGHTSSDVLTRLELTATEAPHDEA